MTFTATLDLASRPRVLITSPSCTGHGFSQTTAHLTLPRRSGQVARGQGHGACAGAPYHPQTQGKIERWHQTLKNRILLDNYYLPGDLERQIEAFVEHYNHARYHESINNLTPADVYLRKGRDNPRRARTHQACNHRKPPLAASAAGRLNSNPDEPEPPFSKTPDQSQFICRRTSRPLGPSTTEQRCTRSKAGC